MNVSILVDAIKTGTTFLYGCTGETIMEKSGHLNLGTPGIMCMGAFGGCWGVSIYMSAIGSAQPVAALLILTALLFSALVSLAGGLIYAFLTVTLRVNQNVTGLALTTFGVGFMKFFGKRVYDSQLFARAYQSSFAKYMPIADKLGWFGQLFLSYGIMVYLSIAIALIAAWLLKKTKTGLHLRAIGENPSAADAVGVNVEKYKYFSIIIGCIVAGLGGLYYVMDKSMGTTFVEAQIDSFGWLAVALVIFTLWKPDLGILGSVLFGFLSIAPDKFTVPLKAKMIFECIPYVVTVIVLIITSMLNSKENQPPASLGLSYFREER